MLTSPFAIPQENAKTTLMKDATVKATITVQPVSTQEASRPRMFPRAALLAEMVVNAALGKKTLLSLPNSAKT